MMPFSRQRRMFFFRWAVSMFRLIIGKPSCVQSEALCRGLDVLQTGAGNQHHAIFFGREAISHLEPTRESRARRRFVKKARSGRKGLLRRENLGVGDGNGLSPVALELAQGMQAVAWH